MYGQCSSCGRSLKNHESVERGMGPVCAARLLGDAIEEEQMDLYENDISKAEWDRLLELEPILIEGDSISNTVRLNKQMLDPGRGQKLRNHSPDGFAWGYGGSGPAQLALSIMLAVTNSRAVTQALYQEFKWRHVQNWPHDHFRETIDIASFLKQHESLIQYLIE